MTSSLGTLIRNARVKAGLSQYCVAVSVGKSEGYICKLERGRLVPTLAVMTALIGFLEIDHKEFVDCLTEAGGVLK